MSEKERKTSLLDEAAAKVDRQVLCPERRLKTSRDH